MKEELNNIIEELEITLKNIDNTKDIIFESNEEIEYQYRRIDERLGDIENYKYDIDSLSSRLEEISSQIDETNSGLFTKIQIEKIVENVVCKYNKRIRDYIDGILWIDLLEDEFDNFIQNENSEL